MPTKFDSNNFIIINFPSFAGGKFISNCLSLSKFCCPQDPVSAKHLLEYPDDYDYRLKTVLRTIPPTQSAMIDWISTYEFGDYQLYQESFNNWARGIWCEPNDLTNRLIKSKLKLFLTAHGGDVSVRNLLNVCTDATIIKLINHVKFSKISQSLKSLDNKPLEEYAGNYCETKYNYLAGPAWPGWKDFESVGYDIQQLAGYESVADEILSFYNWSDIKNTTFLFDVDDSIFSRDKFLSAIESLYQQLGLWDFNSMLVDQFWQSYMQLHVDNIE